MDIVVMIGTAGATRVAVKTLTAEDEGGETTAAANVATIARVEKAAQSTVVGAASMIVALVKDAAVVISGRIAAAVTSIRADSAAIAETSLEGSQAVVATDRITAGTTTTAASMAPTRAMAAGARAATSTRRIVSFTTEAAATSVGIETMGFLGVKGAGSGVLQPTRSSLGLATRTRRAVTGAGGGMSLVSSITEGADLATTSDPTSAFAKT
jgi:hypothetical protein